MVIAMAMPKGYRHTDEAKKAIGEAARKRMAALPSEPMVCEGCQKAYKGAHGLKVHQARCEGLGGGGEVAEGRTAASGGKRRGRVGYTKRESGVLVTVETLEEIAKGLEEQIAAGSFFDLKRAGEKAVQEIRGLAA